MAEQHYNGTSNQHCCRCISYWQTRKIVLYFCEWSLKITCNFDGATTRCLVGNALVIERQDYTYRTFCQWYHKVTGMSGDYITQDWITVSTWL